MFKYYDERLSYKYLKIIMKIHHVNITRL